MNATKRWLLVAVLCFCALDLRAQSPGESADLNRSPDSAHWAFSSFFGTGWYQLDQNRSVFVLNVQPRKEWIPSRPPTAEVGEEDGTLRERTGVDILFPLTLGIHNIDDIPGLLEPENFGTASFTPGLEFEVPVTPDWFLRPYIKAGIGRDFTDDDNAWIGIAGIKSRYRLTHTNAQWDVITHVYLGGYNEENAPSDSIAGGQFGAERMAHRSTTIFGSEFNLVWHASYTNLSRPLRYTDPRSTAGFDTLKSFFDIGLAFRPAGQSFRLGPWQPEQLGVALEVGSDGDYFAIKFNSSKWFHR